MIFDVDGTLYDQTPVRLKIALRMAVYVILHPFKWRSFYGIYVFRKIREKSDMQSVSFDEQVEFASKKAKTDAQVLRSAIDRWMFDVPLDLIKKHRYTEAISLLHKASRQGVKIIIYSDYDPTEKLKALGITPDFAFYPDGKDFCELKPSKKAMQAIISKVGIEPENLIYVGDRQEKDGASARLAGIYYIDIKLIK